MKKIFIGTVLLSVASLLADIDIKGPITAVNQANKTITIQGARGIAVVQVLPHTELKGDDCGAFGHDVYGTFNDLAVGRFVEAEVFPSQMPMQGMQGQMPTQGAMFVAKEIEWKCGRPAAY